MKDKRTFFDLGCDRGWKGRPPSALGLYIMALLFWMFSIFAFIVGERENAVTLLLYSLGIWFFAWFISVPLTDKRKGKR